jgi:hypothetical protein
MERQYSQCASKLPYDFMKAKEIAYSRGGICLSTEYINLYILMQRMCNKDQDGF